METVKAHVPHLPSSSTTGQGSTSTRSTSDIQAQASQQASSVLASAQKLAQQATEYAQQGVHQIVEKLPESVTSHLPAQITTLGTDQHKPMEHAATGQKAYEFTEPHTTANFEASGEHSSGGRVSYPNIDFAHHII